MQASDPTPPEDPLSQAVLEGYRQGAFPMAISDDADPHDDPHDDPQWGGRPRPPADDPQQGGRHARPALAWYTADPRGVIRLKPPGFHIPRRLARTMRSGRFEITSDQAFGRVIRACADPRREGGWINPELIAIFDHLHAAGHAHSVEAWLPLEEPPVPATRTPDADAEAAEASDPAAPNPDAILHDPAHNRILVGGLYGLRLGSIFCGEAMFSRPELGGRDASKVCLVRTILHLRQQGFTLLDTQMHSDHLAQFGCEEIGCEVYQRHLRTLRDHPCRWSNFAHDTTH